MEKRIHKKVSDYISNFKNNIISEIQSILSNEQSNIQQQLINNVYNYPYINIEKEDFIKRKRIKNIVPVFERCCAKRANNEQCTRRKKESFKFCGTHVKGTPHGHIDDVIDDTIHKKIDVFVVEIKGIAYYIDDKNNVYSPEDVMSNKECPRIISHYTQEDGIYSIV